MRKLMLLAAVAMFGVGCGAAGVGAGSNPSPSPSDTSPMHFDVTATETDKAVSMHVGQKLELVLHGGNQIMWQQVKSSDTTILEPTVNPAATAMRGVTLAAFKARSAGEVQVTAVGTAVCPAGQPCPMFAMLYTLTVTITP
jgi:hypothetical protein